MTAEMMRVIDRSIIAINERIPEALATRKTIPQATIAIKTNMMLRATVRLSRTGYSADAPSATTATMPNGTGSMYGITDPGMNASMPKATTAKKARA